MSTACYPHASLTRSIIKSFFQVYGELGYGFLESVYRTALALVIKEDGINCQQEVSVPVHFRGREIGKFRTDPIVEKSVVVELKAVRKLDGCHEAQLLNCLKATSIEVGLLLNFGPKPQIKRLVFSDTRARSV